MRYSRRAIGGRSVWAIAVGLILATVISSPAQQRNGEEIVPSRGTAGRSVVSAMRLTISDTLLDFGSVAIGSMGTASATLANDNSTAITVSLGSFYGPGVQAQAFRIESSLPIMLSSGGKGDTASLSFSFRPVRQGWDTAFVEITDSLNTHTITLIGYGIPYRIDRFMIDFGTVASGATRTDTFRITNLSSALLSVDSVRIERIGLSTGAFLDIQSRGKLEIDPQNSVLVTVGFRPLSAGEDSAYWRGRLFDGSEIIVSLRGVGGSDTTARDSVTLSATELDFECVEPDSVGAIATDSLPSLQLTIRNGLKGNLRIDSLVESNEDSTFFIARERLPQLIQASGSGTIVVRYHPRTPSTEYRDTLTIHTSVGPFIVLLKGISRPSLTTVAPMQIAVGPVSVCDSSVVPIVITHRGCRSAAINVVQLTGDPAFSIRGRPANGDSIPDGGSDTVLVSFKGGGKGTATLSLRIDGVDYQVFLNGSTAATPTLAISADTLAFDTVDVASASSDSLLTLTNRLADAAFLEDIRLTGDNPGDFSFDLMTPYDSAVGIRQSLQCRIRFTPTDTGLRSATLSISLRCGPTYTIVLTGFGRIIEDGEPRHVVEVESDSAHVGKRFMVDVRLVPPPTRSDGINGYTVEISIPWKSFFVHRVFDGGDTLLWSHAQDGTLSVRRDPGGALLVDTTLLTIELEGLPSGNARNIITVDGIALFGSDPRLLSGSEFKPGVLILSGCDVGSGIGFSKATALRTIKPNPVVGDAEVEYVAARNSHPFVEIVDVNGRLGRRIDLPVGTGERQSVRLSVEGLPPGAYIVRLRMESEQSAVLMIIDR